MSGAFPGTGTNVVDAQAATQDSSEVDGALHESPRSPFNCRPPEVQVQQAPPPREHLTRKNADLTISAVEVLFVCLRVGSGIRRPKAYWSP